MTTYRGRLRGDGAGWRRTLTPGSVPALALVFRGLLGIGLGAINTLIFALQADTVDYGEGKTGTSEKRSSMRSGNRCSCQPVRFSGLSATCRRC